MRAVFIERSGGTDVLRVREIPGPPILRGVDEGWVRPRVEAPNP